MADGATLVAPSGTRPVVVYVPPVPPDTSIFLSGATLAAGTTTGVVSAGAAGAAGVVAPAVGVTALDNAEAEELPPSLMAVSLNR